MAEHDGSMPPIRAWIPLITFLMLLVVVLLGLWFKQAETPFGIGNGKVPDIVGRDRCAATQALAKRELRWRFESRPRIHDNAERASRVSSPDCSDDKVLRQSPDAGRDLGEGGLVRLATVCSDAAARGGGCG